MAVKEEVLQELKKGKKMHISGLANRINRAKSSVSRAVKQLKEEGLVDTKKEKITVELGEGINDWWTEVKTVELK